MRNIDAAPTLRRAAHFWWLGQFGFVFKLAGKTVYVDPFFTAMRGRKTASPIAPEEAAHADLVLGTHDHLDHIDRPAWPLLAKASPKALFIVPALLKKSLAKDLGLPQSRFIGLDAGESFRLDGLRVSAVPAAHESLDRDRATGRYPYLGYVLEAEGRAIYHSGDCCPYPSQEAWLKKWKLDLACLPINGRGRRKFIGNMSETEAAALAGGLKPALTVPAHYDMFEDNAGDPRAFVAHLKAKHPGLKALIPDYGKRYKLP
jgi:L-ascorbate metabolism protein UlaG (beta-lactamase superfamily)